MVASGTGARRVQRRREKLRAAGMRPVQIWVPDTRAPGFADECARQSRLIRDSERSERGVECDDWHDSSDTTGWTG